MSRQYIVDPELDMKEVIKKYKQQHPDVNRREVYEGIKNGLLSAAKHGNTKAMAHLIEALTDIEGRTNEASTIVREHRDVIVDEKFKEFVRVVLPGVLEPAHESAQSKKITKLTQLRGEFIEEFKGTNLDTVLSNQAVGALISGNFEDARDFCLGIKFDIVESFLDFAKEVTLVDFTEFGLNAHQSISVWKVMQSSFLRDQEPAHDSRVSSPRVVVRKNNASVIEVSPRPDISSPSAVSAKPASKQVQK